MKAKIASLVAAFGLCGCGPTHVAFDHPSADESQMIADRYECLRSSMGNVSAGMVSNGDGWMRGATLPNEALYLNCMVVHGYTQNNESGRLVVPPSLMTRTYR
jgi:hypothetical protein